MTKIMTNEEKRLYAIYKDQAEPKVTAWDFGVKDLRKASCCPLHNDNTPSFTVFKSREGNLMFKCHSQCGAGDYLKFVEKRDGLSRKDALMQILSQFSIDPNAKKNTASSGSSTSSGSNASSSSGNNDADALALEAEIDKINSTYATVMVGGNFKIVKERAKQGHCQSAVSFGSPESLKYHYANKRLVLPSGVVVKNLGDAWIKHPKRRSYEAIDFMPNQADCDTFNLWRGFDVEPNPSGSCSLYLKHIHDNIADGNEEIYEYLLNWMADAIQNPEKLSGVALAIRGLQGTGKGVYVSNFAWLYGCHATKVTNKKQLLGNFNAHLKDCVLLNADEAFWSGDKEMVGTLKALITEKEKIIEHKGLDAITVNNYVRLIITSNEDWVVPADVDDRRFCVIDCGKNCKEDVQYFEAIENEMENGGRGALLQFLLNRDISKVNIRKFPKTKAAFDNILQSMDSVQKFVFNLLDESGEDEWRMERNSDKLYDEYREYVIKELGHFRPVEKAQFGSGLGKIIRVEITRKRYGDGRKKFYQFPSLADCRKDMERLAKMDIPWSFPLEEVDDVFAEVVADAVAVIPVAVKAIEESCDDDFSFTDEELMEFLDSCDVQQFEDDDDSLVWVERAKKPRFGKGRYSFGHNLEIE